VLGGQNSQQAGGEDRGIGVKNISAERLDRRRPACRFTDQGPHRNGTVAEQCRSAVAGVFREIAEPRNKLAALAVAADPLQFSLGQPVFG